MVSSIYSIMFYTSSNKSKDSLILEVSKYIRIFFFYLVWNFELSSFMSNFNKIIGIIKKKSKGGVEQLGSSSGS